MNLRPDFKKCVTGYVWLDKITAPVWTLYEWWSRRQFFLYLGDGDVEKGRRIMRAAADAETPCWCGNPDCSKPPGGWQ